MNSKIVLIIILAIVVIGGVIWYLASSNENTNSNLNTTTNTVNALKNANASTNAQANKNVSTTNTQPVANTNSPVASNLNVANSNTQQNSEDTVISVQLDEYSFSPSAITIQEGETATLRLSNIGSMEHDFVIDALSIDSGTLDPGDSTTITITRSQTGTFEFYCSIGSHRALGMKGTLTVI